MSDLDTFMAAITAQESSGRPQVTNPESGAHGLFQIMPQNWSGWAREAGLGPNAPKTPENQTQVAKNKMQQYYDQFGSWDAVAVAWFAGPGRARRYVNGDTSVLNLSDGNATVGEYIEKMRAGMSGGGTTPRRGPMTQQAIAAGEVPDVSGGETTGTDPREMWRTILTTLADQTAGGQREPLDAIEANEDLGAASAGGGGEEGSEDLLNDAIARWTPNGDAEASDGEELAADGDSERSPTTAALDEVRGLDQAFVGGLQQLIADAPGKVTITSGYRSPERQEVLWQRALKKYGSESAARKWVAPPGNSQHNHGKAADLSFESDEVRRWVHANAAKYGVHFPLANEPWHAEVEGSRS